MNGYGSYYNVPGARASMSGLGCGCSSGFSLGTEMQIPPIPEPPETDRPWLEKHKDDVRVAAYVGSFALAAGILYFTFGRS